MRILRREEVSMAEMIDVSDISLLYPDGESMRRAGLGESGGRLSDVTAEQLELYYLIDLKSSDIGSFFTCDVETIRYRQKTFADMAENPVSYTHLTLPTILLV